MRKYGWQKIVEGLRISVSSLGSDIRLKGAATLAFLEFIRDHDRLADLSYSRRATSGTAIRQPATKRRSARPSANAVLSR